MTVFATIEAVLPDEASAGMSALRQGPLGEWHRARFCGFRSG